MEREGGLRVSVLDNGGIVKVNRLDKRLVQTEKGEVVHTFKRPVLGSPSNFHSWEA